jgi:hypothetical protein
MMGTTFTQLGQDADWLGASPKDQIGYLSSVDKDFASASPEDQEAYRKYAHDQAVLSRNAPQKPSEGEGFFHHGAKVLGRQLWDIATASFKPYSEAYKGYEAAKAGGSTPLKSLAYGGVMGLNQVAGDPLGQVTNAAETVKGYKGRREAGYNPAYAAAAPVAAPLVGVNLPAMEQAAAQGHTREVAAEAAVPAGEAIAGEAVSQAFKPGAYGTRALNRYRTKAGVQNIIGGLDVPAGPGGERAADMARNVQLATNDLAEIGRDTPGKVQRMLSRTENSDALHNIADKIEVRMDDMWDKGHEPGIARHAQAPIDHLAVRGAGDSALTQIAVRNAPEEAAAARKWLDSVTQDTTLKQADDLVREINSDLRARAKSNNPYSDLQTRVRNRVVKQLRSEIDRTLTTSGEAAVRDVNQRWGALNTIHDRLVENAVTAARKEAKAGPLPSWAHTYMFLHPDLGAAVGLGVNLAKMGAPSMPGRTLKGFSQLGKTGLTAPYEATPPPSWGAPPRGLLPAPTPPTPQLQGPGGQAPMQTGPYGTYGFPTPPTGVPAPRQTYRAPATGRMQRGYTSEMPMEQVGHTAEGGPIYETRQPPFKAPTPVENRGAMWGAEPKYIGPERRVAGRGNPADLMRTYRMNVLQRVIDDPTATARDKAIAREQLSDMMANPFERTNPEEVNVATAKAKGQKKMTREEATAASEKRKEGQRARAAKKTKRKE